MRDVPEDRPHPQSYYYNEEMVPPEFLERIQESGASRDELDNILYALLKYYDSDLIRSRLRLAAETHPNEIARAIKTAALSPDESEPLDEIDDDDWDQLSKKEQARRLLGGR